MEKKLPWGGGRGGVGRWNILNQLPQAWGGEGGGKKARESMPGVGTPSNTASPKTTKNQKTFWLFAYFDFARLLLKGGVWGAGACGRTPSSSCEPGGSRYIKLHFGFLN